MEQIIYEVKWQDTTARLGWHTEDEICDMTFLTVTTVGYRVLKTKDAMIMAGMIDSDNSFGNFTIIPTQNIISITEIDKTTVSDQPHDSAKEV